MQAPASESQEGQQIDSSPVEEGTEQTVSTPVDFKPIILYGGIAAAFIVLFAGILLVIKKIRSKPQKPHVDPLVFQQQVKKPEDNKEGLKQEPVAQPSQPQQPIQQPQQIQQTNNQARPATTNQGAEGQK